MSWVQITIIFSLGFWLGSFWQLKRQHRIQSRNYGLLTRIVDRAIDEDQALYARGTGDKTGSLGESHPIEPTRRRERTNVAGVKSIEPSFLNRKQEGTRGGATDSPEAA